MNILSLFDWISCARVALDRVWLSVENYIAYEIDKYAIKISKNNYPDIVQMWDIRSCIAIRWRIDLLVWWSPCQDLSIAKKDRKWLDGDRSWLFWEYVRILKQINPKYFILENVASMPKEAKDTITTELWVQPIMIDASLVSAQSRKRLFWTNIPVEWLPEDRCILLKDILQNDETDDLKSYCVTTNYAKLTLQNYLKWQWQIVRVGQFGKWWQGDRIYSIEWKSVTSSANWWWRGAKTWLYKVWNINPSWKWMNGDVYSDEWKSPTLTTNKGEWRKIVQRARWFNAGWEFAEKSPTLSSSSWQHNNHLHDGDIIRKLTPIECERLQWLPDNYTQWVSNSQRYKLLWNAFNVDVVAHIISFLPYDYKTAL